jgi:carboxylesterase type B
MIFPKALLELFPFIVSPTLVTLSSGTFRGLTVNSTDRWLGIPYAQPPLGSLRFKSPVPISRPAEGVQDALRFSPACPQPPTTASISEDCLYLNVRSAISDWGQ